MNEVTLVELRKNAEKVLRRIQRGERLVLTRRGRPIARLEPIIQPFPGREDPIYRLGDLAPVGGRALSNRDIDRAIYGF